MRVATIASCENGVKVKKVNYVLEPSAHPAGAYLGFHVA